jgi:KilA-N domain
MTTRFLSKNYLGKSVRIDPISKLVSLTDTCKATGKNVADFLRLQGTTDYIHALSCAMGIPIEKLLVVGKSNQGTWGHPQLAIKCAAWVSASFEVLMTSWVWELLTTGKVELNTASTPAVVIAIDDSKRMHNAGHSIALRDFAVAGKKSKRSVPDGWLTVGEWLQLIMGDRKAAKDAGVIFWLSRQISDLYRSNTGYEPPKVPCKRGSVYCYPLEYREKIAAHYHSWSKTHAEQLVAVQLRLANSPKQINLFDPPEAT